MHWQRWLKLTLDGLIVLLVVWLLLVAAYVSLGRQFVPAVADYQVELLDWVQEKTGRYILLDKLEGEMQGAQPVLTLHGLQVHADANPASPVLFALEDVIARVDIWSSLWQRRLVMDALQIEGLALELVEDGEGRWQLYGLGDRDVGETGLDDALEVLLDQRRITLLNTRIQISPHEQPQWLFREGDLTLLNAADGHRLDAQVKLPDGQLVRLQASAASLGRHWQDLTLGFFLELPAIDWVRYLPAPLLETARLQELVAGGRFWGRWGERQLQALQGQLIAPVVVPAVDPLPDQSVAQIRDLLADFQLQLGAEQRLQIDNLTLRLNDRVWPRTRLQGERNEQGHWALRMDLLPLALVSQGLAPLLTNEVHRQQLATLAPEGFLRDIHLRGGADPGDLDSLHLSATLDRVGIAAWEGVPALQGISGTIEGSPGAGQLRVDSQRWGMHLPRLFPQPWAYARLQGQMGWQWTRELGLNLDAQGLKVTAEEGPVAVNLGLHIPPAGGVPSMSLQVALRDSDAVYAEQYLPTRAPAFNPALVDWLTAADFQGQVPLAIFQFEGSLLREATRDERQLDLYLQVEQGSLNFQPGWPRLEQVRSVVRLNNTDLTIQPAEARLLNTQLSKVVVTTGRASAAEPLMLTVAGHAEGPLADALTVMQDTPLAQTSGDPLAGWQGSGQLAGDLSLAFPLNSEQSPQIRVNWQAQVQQLQIPPLQTPLTNLTGDFEFDLQQGLKARNLKADALGGPVTGSIEQVSDEQRIQLSGRHSIDQLRAWPLLDDLPDDLLDSLAKGAAEWRAAVTLGAGQQRIEVSSNLQGIALNLPGPLAKPADRSLPSSLILELDDQRQRWSFNLGEELNGRLRTGAGELSGDISYRRSPVEAASVSGLSIRAGFDQLNLDEWQRWVETHSAAAGEVQTAQTLRGTATDLVSSIDLRAARFSGFGQQLEGLAVTGARVDDVWLFDIDQARIRGQVTLPDVIAEPVLVNLQRLQLERPAEAPMVDALAKPLLPEDSLRLFKPSTLPPVDLHIDQLYWAGDPVGAVDMRLRPDNSGAKIHDLDVNLRGLQLSGELDWRDSGPRSHFKGQMLAGNMGEILKAWGYAPTLTSDSFAMQADLSWPGSPIFFALSRSTGQLQLQAKDGALQSGETGADALRIFGLLNFNAFTRRLRLDFSDLFGSGTAYDTLKGDMVFTDGVMYTVSPLVMDGPGAKLQLDGKLDLAADQIDMGMLVTLPVTNNLPLAALIVGAPYIGGALFIADKILGDRVARFASVKYKISGDWKQPNVEFDRAFDSKAALEGD
ncbi:YhdP family protein [Halopseudomonas pelagia]|uniref:YhdP family protein n=1 Tax=Halopseudomonas pelagia TaxID=553151 RepID=UPI0030DC3693|tara:strand:+ start:45627 stop:49505 length:3879 start_codon:yes stop_codon:yes gene_type:complete